MALYSRKLRPFNSSCRVLDQELLIADQLREKRALLGVRKIRYFIEITRDGYWGSKAFLA